MNALSRTFLALLILAGAVSASAQDLSIRLEPKQSFQYRMKTDQKGTQTAMGQKIEFNGWEENVYQFDVLKKNGADYEVAVKLVSYKMSSENPQTGKMEYDSEKGGTAPDAAQAQAYLIGKPYTIVLSPTGEVKSVVGAEKLRDGMLKKIKLTNEEGEAKIRKELYDSHSPDALKKEWTNFFGKIPPAGTKTGGTWTKRDEKVGKTNVVIEDTLKLESLDGEKAVILSNNRITPHSNNPEFEVQEGMKAKVEVRGVGTGTRVISPKTGLPISGNGEANMTTRTKITGPMTMDIPGTMKVATTTELITGK